MINLINYIKRQLNGRQYQKRLRQANKRLLQQIARDKAYIEEASKHTTILTEPFNDFVTFMGKTVHVCVLPGEQLEVPHWVKYVIDQSKQDDLEARGKGSKLLQPPSKEWGKEWAQTKVPKWAMEEWAKNGEEYKRELATEVERKRKYYRANYA